MIQYNMLDAKNNLSKICRMLKNNEEDCVVIATNGEPVAKIIPYGRKKKKIIGALKNKYEFVDVDWFNDDITNLFYGDEK